MKRAKNYRRLGEVDANDRQIDLPIMVSVCAWCNPGSAGSGSKVISHGICMHHLRKMRLELMKRARAGQSPVSA